MGSQEKTFADKELENEMGYFKEPIVRLKQVTDGATESYNQGSMDRALFLRMQASDQEPWLIVAINGTP